MQKQHPATIIGASGYTGSELIRLLIAHPYIYIKQLVAARAAGKQIDDIFCQFTGCDLPKIIGFEQAVFEKGEIIFCALPHGTSQEVIKSLPKDAIIIDLSADFRLQDPMLYEQTYGAPHIAMELQQKAVYGLCEINRKAIKNTNIIACPGCYPTASITPLYPLIKNNLINPQNIIIDAKSGTSGAGRSEKQDFLFCEVNEDLRPYAIAKHRHAPEIEHQLAIMTNQNVQVSFTPHLIPMMRGIITSIYVELAANQNIQNLHQSWQETYKNEPFILLLDDEKIPSIKHVKGTNKIAMNLFKDRLENRAILVAAEDNLVKGASGQAIQNMNIIMGFDEKLMLETLPILP